MKIINHFKAGASAAPAFLIILYYLFVALDLFTTYLVTPDLKLEVNWFVRFFNLNWSHIIIIGSLNALLTSSLFIISLSFINSYYQENSVKCNLSFIVEVFHKKRLLISVIIFSCFYSHFFASVFVTINNYLNYLYLYRIENVLTRISTCYINIEMVGHPFFFIYIKTFLIIAAIFFSAYKVKKIRNKYRKLSVV